MHGKFRVRGRQAGGSAMATKEGVVGLGAMGGGIALALRKAGFAVVGFDLKDALMAELEDAGGKRAHSPRDVAERSDAVILSLPSTEAFHDVATGQGGIAESGRDSLVVFDTSTLAVADKEAAATRHATSASRCSTAPYRAHANRCSAAASCSTPAATARPTTRSPTSSRASRRSTGTSANSAMPRA
ncbi:MAG: hypothetical protein FJX53_06210 [Alphaproteobacteria bacterium]|nr:hypothetical protein [Alphaproteobacteria bacterium]